MFVSCVLEYPIVFIEDPFDKEDWEHTKYFSSLGICQVVGDDLLMSNSKRVERAIQESACNALLLKGLNVNMVNQIGTVTEAIEVVKLARDAQGERTMKYNQLLRIDEELWDQAVYARED
ncbi:hypothetical protein AALP_AA6G228500 [Arabis alpina]|uniref:phosphopyruvate hydratase n=1 Tax=Arabis alpina TaxID=50452 RepID=A0A087GR34_ARAAL|nr:hypothetical protein AALP_AA6G228500 [Arabis alpina]